MSLHFLHQKPFSQIDIFIVIIDKLNSWQRIKGNEKSQQLIYKSQAFVSFISYMPTKNLCQYQQITPQYLIPNDIDR